MQDADALAQDLVRRAWNDGALLPLHFRAAVLNQALQRSGAQVLRTDTVGRLLVPGRSALDFGIVESDRLIHLRLGDLQGWLPDAERDHWLEHLVSPPLSRSLLWMQRAPGSCHDDGPIRKWRPPEAAR